MLESLDNGKPIKESRDVDIPLAAAHFFYYAGWADKLEYAGFGPSPRPLGVAAQVIPWNFPLLMAAWKIAPALAAGNTVVLKPAETTPLTALTLAEIIAEADLPPGVVNIVTGGPSIGQALVEHSGRRQDRVHRLDRGRQADPEGAPPAPASGSRSSSAARRPTSSSTTRRIDQAVEGIVNGIFFNQGHVCCAGSRLLVQESIADEVVDALKRRLATLRLGDPLDKNTDIGAINSAAQLARIRELVDSGDAEGATRWSPPCELPEPRLLVRADRLHRRVAGQPHRPRGDLRPGAVGAHLPHAGRGGREGEQHPVRPLGRHLDREGLADPLDGRAAAGRRRLGEHVQPLRPGVARSAATRSPDSAARAAGTAWRPTLPDRNERLDVRKTYKLYIGGAFPRSESGRSYPVTGPTARCWPTRPRPRARTSATRSSPRARPSPGWSGATAYNRGQVLYRVAEMLEGRRDQFAAEVAAAEQVSAGGGGRRRSPRRSTAGSGTRAGPTSSRRSSASANPVAGAYFNFSLPEPTGVVGVCAPQESSLLGLVSVLAPVIATGNTAVVLASERSAAAGGEPERGARDVRPARRRGQPAHRHRPAELAPWLARHRDVNALDLTGVAAGEQVGLQQAAADTIKRVYLPVDAAETWIGDPGTSRLTRVRRDQDGVAPDRRLT